MKQFKRRKIVVSDEVLDRLGCLFVDLKLHQRTQLSFQAFVALFYTFHLRSLWMDLVNGAEADLGDLDTQRLSRRFWASDPLPGPIVHQSGVRSASCGRAN